MILLPTTSSVYEYIHARSHSHCLTAGAAQGVARTFTRRGFVFFDFRFHRRRAEIQRAGVLVGLIRLTEGIKVTGTAPNQRNVRGADEISRGSS